ERRLNELCARLRTKNFRPKSLVEELFSIADAWCKPRTSRQPISVGFSELKSGASGEIRTLKHLFLRQAAIPIRARWHFLYEGSSIKTKLLRRALAHCER